MVEEFADRLEDLDQTHQRTEEDRAQGGLKIDDPQAHFAQMCGSDRYQQRFGLHIQKGCKEVLSGSQGLSVLNMMAKNGSRTPEWVQQLKHEICVEELQLWCPTPKLDA